ncbi:alpha/beta fold hydrolase [Nakamurella sp. YIM 132087]|uniref:Alpha/beta fold hydrolase n=1 Tax=Nakamurella alba TaxID=2665158 RepID=A0A7K1FQX7_9ACTN|nr:alpha/beta fold hydrolase [Nakamurella alba]MTD15769.1 alpha/beta fold hydrolase [Nakamurella alba]
MSGPIVLVHGAQHGGWCWRRVLPGLRSAGHEVHAPTLTGLADRAHLLTASTGLSTHIDDVAAHLEAEELTDVTLVGHSYGALVVTGVADRLPGKVRTVVLFDGPVARAGESGVDLHPAAHVFLSRETVVDGIPVIPPSDGSSLGLDPDDLAWVRRRLTPQPARAVREGLPHSGTDRTSTIRHCFIRTQRADGSDSALPDRAAGPGWTVRTVPGGHDAMITRPGEVVAVLHELAELPPPDTAEPTHQHQPHELFDRTPAESATGGTA